MPKISCWCGARIDLSTVPCPSGFKLLAESKLEDLVDSIANLRKEAKSDKDFERGLYGIFWPLGQPSPHIYQCETCGRLAVLKQPSDEKVSQWYLPEYLGEKTYLQNLLSKD